jgi:hypothetical protein
MRGSGQTHNLAAADSPTIGLRACHDQPGSYSRAYGALRASGRETKNMKDKFPSTPQTPAPVRRSCGKAWLTLGTVAAYAAVSISKSMPAWAQDAASHITGKPQEQQSLTVRRLNIPAGPLDAVLRAYEASTGIDIGYAVPQLTIAGFHSPGVTGLYTEDQALRALLSGTGLSYQLNGAGKVTVVVAASESVTVVDHAVQLGLDRYPVPLLDTPQSITAISQATIHEEGATTLRDTLRNAPGISLAAGEGGSQGDNLTLRGFTARNDIFLDGMRDFGSYYRDPFNYQEVEVLEGPSSVTFGRGSTGGVINRTMPGWPHATLRKTGALVSRLPYHWGWARPIASLLAISILAKTIYPTTAYRGISTRRLPSRGITITDSAAATICAPMWIWRR